MPYYMKRWLVLCSQRQEIYWRESIIGARISSATLVGVRCRDPMYRVEGGADLIPSLEAGQTPRFIAPKKAKQPMRQVIFWLFVNVMNLRKIGDQDKKQPQRYRSPTSF